MTTLRERFEARVLKTPACWLWSGLKRDDQYGNMRINGQMFKAHRIAYELYRGPIGEGLEVCHSCDIPRCVNPAHLWLGTHIENMLDAQSKGRMDRQRKAKGFAHYRAKLTPEQIASIRADTRTQRIVAAEYDIAQSSVSRIRTGRRWA